jgi:hypothetical protein
MPDTMPDEVGDRLEPLLAGVRRELLDALALHGEFASLHEGYAVLLEELDELWEETRKKKRSRSRDRVRAESIQIAAMALKIALTFGG